jgi:hypothetical protein
LAVGSKQLAVGCRIWNSMICDLFKTRRQNVFETYYFIEKKLQAMTICNMEDIENILAHLS